MICKINLFHTFLPALKKMVIVVIINKLIFKACISYKKTRIIDYKSIILIIRLLQKTYSNFCKLYDLVFINGNKYFVIIIDNNIKKI